MITRLDLQNIRVFQGRWTFDFRPLTILCGTNSSGKSTVLKTPLLLKQSQDAAFDGSIDGALRLVGPNADLGRYGTLVTNGDTSQSIGIGIEISDRIAKRSLARLRGARPKGPAPKKPTLVDYRFSAWLEFRDARDVLGPRVQGGLTPRGLPALTNATFTLAADHDVSMSWRLARSGQNSDDFDIRDDFAAWFPRAYIRSITQPGAKPVGAAEGPTTRFGAHVSGLLPYILLASRPGGGAEDDKVRRFHVPLPPEAERALGQLRTHIENLRYVGPLRAPARRYYPTDPQSANSGDSSGEGIPQLLRDQLGRRITYMPPGVTRARRGTLGVACGQWLHYLRTGQASTERGREILITSLRDFAVEVKVRSSASSSLHALIDSGFGYSQVLPILVECLLAEQGATVLVEQPELHLNPSLQVRLADFFMSVVNNGRQVVLETHSEHLVNAFRVLSAEDESGQLHDKIGITYLDTLNGVTRKLDLLLQEDGMVPDWPPEFFGEALSLTGRLLSAQRRFLGKA